MKYILSFYFVLVFQQLHAQNSLSDDFRFGFGMKLSMEFQELKHISFRASVTAGIGKYIGVNKNGFGTFPSAHLGVLLYNRGVLGSQLDPDFSQFLYLDIFSNITLTTGGKNITNINRLEDKRVPLYHFSDFTANPLENNFKHSFSFGRNVIFSPNSNKKIQYVGFVNLNIARTAQLSYFNDGGPVLEHFGDKKDRYYTGGLVFSAHFKNKTEFNLLELSFHKFTGWQEHAFDASEKLQLDYIPYKNEANFGFNQQHWQLTLNSNKNNYRAFVKVYDVDVWDVQDMLHFSRDIPFHPDYFYFYRIAPGVGYSNINTRN